MLDGAVLAGRIHRLEDRQQRPLVLRVELLLKIGETLDAVGQHLLRLVLFDIEAAGVVAGMIAQPEFFSFGDAEALEDVGVQHRTARF
jgi:hypothetical protein